MGNSKPRIEFSSRGPSGNIFHILSLVRAELRKQQRITDYNDIYFAVTNCNSYNEALEIIREKIDLIDLDSQY
ncbi:MAG: hypothetical protein ACOX24_01185 [Christensenellales bacterium]|jgi:hypothetical protein